MFEKHNCIICATENRVEERNTENLVTIKVRKKAIIFVCKFILLKKI